MKPGPHLFRATREKLANPAPKGQRHAQITEIVCSMVATGFDGDAIFQKLRPNYGPDVSDGEIIGVIRWAQNRIQPGIKPGVNGGSTFSAKRFTKNPVSGFGNNPETAVNRLLNGRTVDEAELFEASPVPLPADWRADFSLFLEALFSAEEKINIVTAYGQKEGKAHPVGKGKTLSRNEWLSEIAHAGPPQGEAGAWIRMNPMDGEGVADANVRACRFCLLECDALAPALQLALFAHLALPIPALVKSGGRSIHAWVRVNAENAEAYRETVQAILKRLQPFGVDQANKNPSRLARLPGAQRSIGRVGDGRQRLLYLAPNQTAMKPIFSA